MSVNRHKPFSSHFNSALIIISAFIITGCALSPEKIATKKAVGGYIDCAVSLAYDWRESHPGKDTFSLFGLANRQCSAEYSNMKQVTRQLIMTEADNQGVKIESRRVNTELDKIMRKGRRSTFSMFEQVYLKESSRTREEFKDYMATFLPEHQG